MTSILHISTIKLRFFKSELHILHQRSVLSVFSSTNWASRLILQSEGVPCLSCNCQRTLQSYSHKLTLLAYVYKFFFAGVAVNFCCFGRFALSDLDFFYGNFFTLFVGVSDSNCR